VEFYSRAADLFSTEDSTSEANKCRLKVAEFVAKAGKYQQAVEVRSPYRPPDINFSTRQIYEDVARQSAEHNLLKYSAKNYLLNAGLCRMCFADVDSLSATLDRYRDIDISFGTSRECGLLENVLAAMEVGDEAKFSEVVAQYDAITKLVHSAALKGDPW